MGLCLSFFLSLSFCVATHPAPPPPPPQTNKQGNLFFGNVEQLWLHVREVLVRMQGLTFLVLDTGEMVGIDFSARERLARICKAVTNRRVHLVWAGLHKPLKEKLKAGGCFENAKVQQPPGSNGNTPAKRGAGRGWSLGRSARHHFAKDMNKAFQFCEDAVLAALGAQDRADDDVGVEEEEEEEEEEDARRPPPIFCFGRSRNWPGRANRTRRWWPGWCRRLPGKCCRRVRPCGEGTTLRRLRALSNGACWGFPVKRTIRPCPPASRRRRP